MRHLPQTLLNSRNSLTFILVLIASTLSLSACTQVQSERYSRRSQVPWP